MSSLNIIVPVDGYFPPLNPDVSLNHFSDSSLIEHTNEILEAGYDAIYRHTYLSPDEQSLRTPLRTLASIDLFTAIRRHVNDVPFGTEGRNFTALDSALQDPSMGVGAYYVFRESDVVRGLALYQKKASK